MDPERYLPLLNQRVEVNVGDSRETHVYLTRVEDISADSIYVVCPISNGEVVPLRVGLPVTVTYVRREGLFSFDATILDRMSGQVPRLRLSRPHEIVRIQRRNHKRIDARFPVKYALPDDDSVESSLDKLCWGDAECVDISAGGIRVRLIDTTVGIKHGSYVWLTFDLPTEESRAFELMAQVIRIERRDRTIELDPETADASSGWRTIIREIVDPEGSYQIALRFVGISSGDEDSIMKFVFDRERELIERGVAGR